MDMVRESTLSFASTGRRLFGIVAHAEKESNCAVLLLHGWGASRQGPSGLLTKLARQFAAAGYSTLRFDFGGRGYSEGSFNQTVLMDMVEDTGAAIELLRCETGAEKVILCGICSGGEVAVASAAKYAVVAGTILLSTPLLGRQELESQLQQAGSQTKKSLAGYAKKLFIAETYRKLFKGKLQWRTIASIIFGHWFKGTADAQTELQLLKSFCAQPKPSLFIYGDSDPETAESPAAYRSHCSDGNSWEFHTVAGANHNFYSLQWHDELRGTILDWLGKRGF